MSYVCTLIFRITAQPHLTVTVQLFQTHYNSHCFDFAECYITVQLTSLQQPVVRLIIVAVEMRLKRDKIKPGSENYCFKITHL